MKRIIFATTNEGKMREVRMILENLGCEILSLKDMNIEIEIEENGKTFEENAIIKAKTIMELTHEIVLADDSGLEVDYLDKAPGIYSARYLGEETDYKTKNQHILKCLEGVEEEKRSARFVSSIACVFPSGEVLTTEATIEGRIGYEESGEHGFGYDPIFIVPSYNCSAAQLSPQKKNEISHRGKALREMKSILEERGVKFT